MKIERDYKVGIISGLITTALFIYFFDPILKFFGSLLFGVFSNISSAYLDRLFAKAALGTPPDPTLFILAGLIGLIVGTAMAVILGIFKKKEKKEEEKTTEKFSSKKLGISAVIFFSFVVLLNFHYFWGTWFQYKLVTSFQQHVTAVAPFISEHEEKLIKSRWTQMKNRKDYENIYQDLKRIAATNGISLPDNLIYSINDF